jgi:hypothetical protein
VGEEMGKGCRRVNMVQILCVHVCKWKGEIQENDGGREFRYDIFDIL